jgi:hypothetical protein
MGGKEKLHCIIILVIIADGWNLQLLMMFKWRLAPECIKLHAGICICVQEDDWMDARLDSHCVGHVTGSTADIEPFQESSCLHFKEGSVLV